MIFKSIVVAGGVEILAADQFIGVPVAVAGNAVVKAGTPVTAAGAAALDGTGAMGILLYDVDPTVNPNGTAVVQGVINWTKAQAHSGATATAAAMAEVLPAVVFRTNIGVNN